MTVVPGAKSATSKNHPKDILCDENHLYRIILVQILYLQLENSFRQLDIGF